MFARALVAFVLLIVSHPVDAKTRNELVLKDPQQVGTVVKSPLPHETLTKEELPESVDYRAQGLLTTDLNQHIPQYCGSCWAHAALSSIGDRIRIGTKGLQRDSIPSVQVMINCGDAGSCFGGDSNAANAWVYNNGIPDVTCQQYQAKNLECSALNTCMTCTPSGGCSPVMNYPNITISEYGTAEGDFNIMAEIHKRGPVTAYINADCIEEYSGGISMYDTCSPDDFNHAIQLNGYGTEDGVDYWIGRNSWGTYWGEHGFFRIVRGGKYNPGTAFWAVPDIKQW